MRINDGRIGPLEGSAAAAVALFICGVFSIDAKRAYGEGNSTYVAIPLSILVSLVLVILLSRAIERSGCADLAEYLDKRIGFAGGFPILVMVSAGMIRCAVKPFSGFLEVLHRLVFDGASYPMILAFVFPVTVFITIRGFESIGRLAVCFGGIILLSLIAAVVSAAPTYEVYRLYPLMGDGTKSFIRQTAEYTLNALPPLLGLLVMGKGLNGLRFAEKCAVRASIVSAAACALTQTALGMTYSYDTLSGLLMPLYRINFLSLSQSYALRLDKLFIMVWICGCVISSAWMLFTASRLFSGFFHGGSTVPAAIAFSALACALILAGFERDYAIVRTAEDIAAKYGAAIVAAAALCAAAPALFVKRRRA